MKIAVIGVRGFPGMQGGVEKHCERIYPLMTRGAAFRVYRRKPYLTSESQAIIPGIEFVDLPSTRIKGFEAFMHTFLCCVHLIFNRVDIVHIHNIGPGLFTPLLRLFGMKVVLTYHSPNYEHDKWGRAAKAILRLGETLSLRFANRIIFVNRFQMDKYPEAVSRKSVYIPNGMAAVSRSADGSYPVSLGVTPGDYLLAVGRITPEKGFDCLVRAVNSSDAVTKLIIAGASDHDTAYLERVKALDVKGKVIFAGYTDGERLRQLYSHARMFALSSVNEGFPLVLLEAMGYGLPVVVTDIPATHLVDLPASRYVAPRDPAAMARALDTLYPSAAPTAYDLTPYNWDKIAAATASLYESI